MFATMTGCIGRRQAVGDRGGELGLGAGAVARLQVRVPESQTRLSVSRIGAHDRFERRDERVAGQLAGRHLRDARRQIAAVFRIRPRTAGGIARRGGRVPERTQPFGGFRRGIGRERRRQRRR